MYILKTNINCYHYLRQDAEYLHNLATKTGGFDKIRLFRTALILYILSLEALANKVMNELLTEPIKGYFLKKEEKFTLDDKFYFLPLLICNNQKTFDRNTYPWSHFKELIKIRNEFLHPKHKRSAYYSANSKKVINPLNWKSIPSDSGIKEEELIYRQTTITRDPYSIKVEDLEKVKRVVDDFIEEFNRLLDGKITSELLHEDKFTIMYPLGATLSDLPD